MNSGCWECRLKIVKPGMQPRVKESPNQRSVMEKEEYTWHNMLAIPGHLKHSSEGSINIKQETQN